MTDEEGWENVDYHEFPALIVDWDTQDTVEGTLIWRETVETQGLNNEPRESTMYAISQPDGNLIGVWSTAQLDPQLKKVQDGAQVRIVFTGTKDLGGARKMRTFTVQTRT